MGEPLAQRAGQLTETAATEALGAALARAAPATGRLFLHGTLGMGKTTLVRGFLHALGHDGPVKSPTYTLVEPYDLGAYRVRHFDLYRLGDPEELEFLGVREDLDGGALCLLEWPENGAGWLPGADLTVTLAPGTDGTGRQVSVEARSECGKIWLSPLDFLTLSPR